MSYAIIINTKYKRENLKGIFRHNERRNKNYSNENIDKEKSYLNYSLKSLQYSYEKEFDRIREKYNLKGQIFICPKSNMGDTQDYKEVFTDMISDRIKEKYKNNILHKLTSR